MRIVNRRRLIVPFALLIAVSACHGIPSTPPPRITVWYVSSPILPPSLDSANIKPGNIAAEGGLVILDSASLRPTVARMGGSGYGQQRDSSGTFGVPLDRFAIISTYQGDRYHPETIRALTDDSLVLATTARTIAMVASSAAGGSHLMLDFQGNTPNDLPRFIDMLRAIGGFARSAMKLAPVAVIVPAGDTVSYPTAVLARIADLLVIRLDGEHRNGTAPGPLATGEFIARAIGIRAEVIGPNRLVAELPLFGYRWDRTGMAKPVTFTEAQALVRSEAGVFRRDQSSQFLTASGRDGWTVWVPDARTVEAMIDAVRRRGVNHIALAGAEGSDPTIPDRVTETIRR